MANNRMYLECRGCGEKILLAKHFGSGYTVYYNDLTLKLDDFMTEHAFCGDVNYENQFKISYEFEYDENGDVK